MTSTEQPFSRWWLVVGVVILIGTVAWMNRGYFHQSPIPPNTPSPPVTLLDQQIAASEASIADHPKTVRPYSVLASYYLQKVRETADASYYNKVDELMNQAAAIDSTDPDIPALRSSVAAGRHHFTEALTQAEAAIALNPDKIAYLGLKADAQIELGRYTDATTTLQTMVDRRPDANAFTRIAYLRDLYGDTSGAIDALEQTLSSAPAFAENRAWTLVELGKLYMRSDPDQAQAYVTEALTLVPQYPPALKWQAMIAAWSGDYTKARSDLTQALASLPTAEYTTDLGDIATLLGDTEKAAQHYALSRIAYAQSSANGVNTDMELAFFLADHMLDLDTALSKAQAAYHDRPGILSADTLAWVWYQKKDFTQAQQYSHEALRLGEHDATIVFHAGMIAYKLNHPAEAKRLLTKALALNPRFSLHNVRVAQDTLHQL